MFRHPGRTRGFRESCPGKVWSKEPLLRPESEPNPKQPKKNSPLPTLYPPERDSVGGRATRACLPFECSAIESSISEVAGLTEKWCLVVFRGWGRGRGGHFFDQLTLSGFGLVDWIWIWSLLANWKPPRGRPPKHQSEISLKVL